MKKHLISLLIISALGIIVYANSLHNEFVWDDASLIKENIYIKNWSYLPKIFTEDMGSGGGDAYHYYRPIQGFSYLLDYSMWRLDVAGYHLTNILLHILVALIIYWLISILYSNSVLSLFTAALFVIHPIHTDAVTYMSGRADPLSALFMLLCFIFYIKRLHKRTTAAYILMVSSYALALFSKENSLTLPALLLVYHYAFREKLRLKEFLSITALAIFYILLRITLLRDSLPDASVFGSLFQRVPGFFAAVTGYIRLMILPLGLHIDYGRKLFGPADWRVILGAVAAAALIIYALRKRKTGTLVCFSVCWFFISLLPCSNIYPPLAFYMAEHYLYLPSVGFFLILASGLVYMYRIKRLKALSIFFTTGILIFYSALTIHQNNYWKNPIAVYERALKYTPDSARLYCNLGDLYNNIGKYEEAIKLIEKAIQLDPLNAEAYNNLGNSYYATGNISGAISMYEKGIRVGHADAKMYNNLANAYLASGNTVNNTEKALSALKKAVEMNPNFAGSYYNLGVIYAGRGENDKAEQMFGRAIEVDPDFSKAYVNLGVLYNGIGKNKEATDMFEKAIAVDPDCGTAYFNLSVIYFNRGRYDLSVEYCNKAMASSYKKIPVEFLEQLKPYRAGNK